MKVKVRKDKKSGETKVEYYKAVDQTNFRYSLLEKIIADIDKDMTVIVDTNQRMKQEPIEQIDKFLEQTDLINFVAPIKKRSNKLLGFNIDKLSKNKNKSLERLVVIEISPSQFTKELFKTCFANYDISVGIGNKKSFKEICDENRFGFNGEILFSKEYFEQSIYDSVVCAILRCSYDVEKYVLEVKNNR